MTKEKAVMGSALKDRMSKMVEAERSRVENNSKTPVGTTQEVIVETTKEATASIDLAEAFKPRRPSRSMSTKKLRETVGSTWYNEEEGLEGVTDELSNEALGILSIHLYNPSQKQAENGTVAGVELHTTSGTIKGIQVQEARNAGFGELEIRMQSRSWEVDGKKSYANDIELPRKVQAQVLRLVSKAQESLAEYTLWYMADTVSLQSVTDESSNPALGIVSIRLFAPSEKQIANGTVAGVQLETVLGTIKGIQVSVTDRDDSGMLYLRTQSRSWEVDGVKNYANDILLSTQVEAQILRYTAVNKDTLNESTGGFWYMEETEELSGVTDESDNPLLGIERIAVKVPSEKQMDNGVVANVELMTTTSTISNLQVLESDRDDSGMLYLRIPSRSWEVDGVKNYINDVELNRSIEAQILRFVESLLSE